MPSEGLTPQSEFRSFVPLSKLHTVSGLSFLIHQTRVGAGALSRGCFENDKWHWLHGKDLGLMCSINGAAHPTTATTLSPLTHLHGWGAVNLGQLKCPVMGCSWMPQRKSSFASCESVRGETRVDSWGPWSELTKHRAERKSACHSLYTNLCVCTHARKDSPVFSYVQSYVDASTQHGTGIERASMIEKQQLESHMKISFPKI